MTSQINLSALAHAAMIEKGFIPDFPMQVQKEINSITPPKLPLKNFNAKDMRKQLWFSIDNDDSRDLDQLTYAESLPNGQSKLYVAVADVTLIVKKGDAIDNRAAHNTTSVYTPTKIFPMLPEKLSTDLTSLNPNVDRLAMVFEGTLSKEGQLQEFSIYLAYVHNYAKLAYDATSAWLDGQAPAPAAVTAVNGMEAQIRLQDSMAKRLAQYRHDIGALSLETIEGVPLFDNGNPVDIGEMKHNRGRVLIENFMIVANMISARYAEQKNIVSLRRIVTIPKRWDKIVELAKQYGTNLPLNPDSKALENFLVDRKQQDPVSFPDLSLTVIKLLGRGEYVVAIPGKNTPGHFGLALKDYTHSTAPNRRFPDLITQRLLIATLSNAPLPYSKSELETIAQNCTQKEDDAEKVERRMRKSAEALVLTKDIGKEFDGIVTGANDKGTWVRIFAPPVDGKLVKGTQNLDVGDKVRVKLVFTDVQKGFIDFVRA